MVDTDLKNFFDQINHDSRSKAETDSGGITDFDVSSLASLRAYVVEGCNTGMIAP